MNKSMEEWLKMHKEKVGRDQGFIVTKQWTNMFRGAEVDLTFRNYIVLYRNSESIYTVIKDYVEGVIPVNYPIWKIGQELLTWEVEKMKHKSYVKITVLDYRPCDDKT